MQLPVGSVLAQAPLEEVAQPGAGHEAAQEPRPDLAPRGEQRGEHEGEAQPGVAGPAHRGQGGLQLGVPGGEISCEQIFGKSTVLKLTTAGDTGSMSCRDG